MLGTVQSRGLVVFLCLTLWNCFFLWRSKGGMIHIMHSHDDVSLHDVFGHMYMHLHSYKYSSTNPHLILHLPWKSSCNTHHLFLIKVLQMTPTQGSKFELCSWWRPSFAVTWRHRRGCFVIPRESSNSALWKHRGWKPPQWMRFSVTCPSANSVLLRSRKSVQLRVSDVIQCGLLRKSNVRLNEGLGPD